MRKAERAGRAACISMEHFGEMLLGLEARACCDINEREAAFRKHRLR
jgi:hypothetical protein